MTRRLHDSSGRRIDNLRISVTDRCNFRCAYCMPEDGLEWLPREDLLTYEEIERVVHVAVGLGIRKVRLTGGEPLLRKDLHVLIGKLSRIEGLRDVGLTTNGILLASQAKGLAEAGLRRINVSLDSLEPQRFQQIVRRDALAGVLRGLQAAAEHFPGPVKVNTVLLRGINDREIEDFAELARSRGFQIRFIEFMPLDADGSWSRRMLVPGSEALEILSRSYDLIPDPGALPSSPSRDYVFADGAPGKIGFIDSVTHPFCQQCNRIRLTADGKLRTCLFSVKETDILSLVRGQGQQTELDLRIAESIRRAVWNKEPGHRIDRPDFVRANRSMSQIGG